MNKAVLVAAALAFAALPGASQETLRSKDRDAAAAREDAGSMRSDRQDDPAQLEFKDRVAGVVESVENACAADIARFCGMVTAGESRVALCMRAHEDRLSGSCQSALDRGSRGLERTLERAAESCLSELRALCGDAGKIGTCVAQKRSSLSAPCQSVVSAVVQRTRMLAPFVGMPVYSADEKNLGQVLEIARSPDGKVQSIQVDIGRSLGLGTKVVVINADKLEQLAGIKVMLSDAEVRSLPDAKKQ